MTRAMKNTFRCVLVLFIISAVSVALLAVANKFLKVVPKLDAKTAALINRIAPTGYDDEEALNGKHIKMVNLASAGYAVTDLADFNGSYGGGGTEVLALYTSSDKTGDTRFVIESQGPGYVDSIVLLTAYDKDNAISGMTVKAQSESYWSHIKDIDAFYASFIGLKGPITVKEIAANTGATVKGTMGGFANAVNISLEFLTQLGGAPAEPPSVVPEDDKTLPYLRKVSDAASFTRYPTRGGDKKKVSAVYLGENGDLVYEALGDAGNYGKVTLLVTANADKTVKKVALVSDSFEPRPENDSSILRDDAILNGLFGGKSAADIKGLSGSLPGTTGATESSDGLKQAVVRALEYIDTFDKEAY